MDAVIAVLVVLLSAVLGAPQVNLEKREFPGQRLNTFCHGSSQHLLSWIQSTPSVVDQSAPSVHGSSQHLLSWIQSTPSVMDPVNTFCHDSSQHLLSWPPVNTCFGLHLEKTQQNYFLIYHLARLGNSSLCAASSSSLVTFLRKLEKLEKEEMKKKLDEKEKENLEEKEEGGER
ncbi:hypothetical protein Hamer_G015577 [Homarus americanus]|uniref:Uncharacterized protein n=1 Tax=Homarus americanus TaxID=6706 RepID=A0A8J5MKQ9_HOMAM|nr:hypothetical protein Hamer_G015577 [Homarus americanus]